MEGSAPEAFANRDEPLPLLTVPASEDGGSSSDMEKGSKRQKLKEVFSGAKMTDVASDLASEKSRRHERSPSIQDRLFAKLLQQVVPDEEDEDNVEKPLDPRSSKYVQRPAFSLPLMTNNFRRFNARIGIIFVFQNRLIRLFTWHHPTHTLSFLSVYTFICLDPYLLVTVPLAVFLLFIMIPAFLARHPPPPLPASTSLTTPYYTYTGPALAPPPIIRPASETSKDFFRNMRDLQNSMADFATVHDVLIATLGPPSNFSNEVLSSTVFLCLFVLTCALFIAAKLIPWRAVFLIFGVTLTVCGHPTVQNWLQEQRKAFSLPTPKPPTKTTTSVAPPPATPSISTPHPSYHHPTILGLGLPTPTDLSNTLHGLSAISLSSAPELREVEIFELQHRSPTHHHSSHSSPTNTPLSEWLPHLFTPTPYDPLSPLRISGERPKGARFFADVTPPPGWAWAGKKWELDQLPEEWVTERLVTGVEYDVVSGGGGHGRGGEEAGDGGGWGGWVWDLPPPPPPPPPAIRGDGSGHAQGWGWEGYGEDNFPHSEKKANAGEAKKRENDWEEGQYRAGHTGEWRRRRWMRVVKRVTIDEGQWKK